MHSLVHHSRLTDPDLSLEDPSLKEVGGAGDVDRYSEWDPTKSDKTRQKVIHDHMNTVGVVLGS